jgi:hypothetical protein
MDKDFDLWEEISNLDKTTKKQLYNSLEKELGFIGSKRDLSLPDLEFEKACFFLKKNRINLPKETEEMIISLAKKYTSFYV